MKRFFCLSFLFSLLLFCTACQKVQPESSPADSPAAEVTTGPTSAPVPTSTPGYFVEPTNDILTVDGEVKTPTAYKIEGGNFIQLRDVAMLLNGTPAQFNVEYDSTLNAVKITTGQPYAVQGWELAKIPLKKAEAIPGNNDIYVNGEKTAFTVYKINGANFFQIRELGTALGFDVDWVKGTGVLIDSGASSLPAYTYGECIVQVYDAMKNRDSKTALSWIEEADKFTAESTGETDCLRDVLTLFDGTYWHICWGETNGTNYYAIFFIDGTYLYTGIDGTEKSGTYTYTDGLLKIDALKNAIFVYTSPDFRSTKKFPMMVGEDYYTITPDTLNRYDSLTKAAKPSPTPEPTPTPTPKPDNSSVPNASDEELLRIANSHLSERWFFLIYLRLGAEFEIDYTVDSIIDSDGVYWFLVRDSRASSLADIQAIWDSYFAKNFSSEPYLKNYREIDGSLYSNCEGVGGDMGYISMEMTSVTDRTETTARLIGSELREDYGSGERYNLPLEYLMVYEDGKWKCAGIHRLEN